MGAATATRGVASKTATYCRICEATCGLLATVERGRLLAVEGDREHVFSRGHFCKKAAGAVEIAYDPDRVTTPLKRMGGPGEFAPVSWEQAMSEIAGQLGDIRRRHGPEAFATFLGQPPTNSYAAWLWLSRLQQLLGVAWCYGVNAEDAAAYQKACELLYGAAWSLPKPDFWRTDFAVVIGANPFVSHGSLCSEPLIREAMKSVTARGGRVVVIDPRRTETAQFFEHVPLKAGSDAWLLAAMLREILVNGWTDRGFVDRQTQGLEQLARLVADFTPEASADRCEVPAETIRALARDFAAAPSALLYGRTGTCTQTFGTLNNLLQNLICIVTGNLDRPGGMAMPWTPIAPRPLVNGDPPPPAKPSRATGLPAVGGLLPSRALIPDILEPGPGQVRALMTLGANPANSSGAAGAELETALDALELHFSLDLYVNETNRRAHYILPVTSMYERFDISTKYMFSQLRPSLWATEAVVPAVGQAREEWRIMNDLCRRLGHGGAYANPWLRRLSALGIEVGPRVLADHLLRMSAIGDGYGRRPEGLSVGKLLKDHPHGKPLKSAPPTGLLPPDRRIDLAPPELASEIARLKAHEEPADYGFRLIGMREVLSHNTWMHNAPSLMSDSRRHRLHINPEDAAALGVGEGELVEIRSTAAALTVPAKLSERMKPGNVALPHGWGHTGGWSHAVKAGGVNSNLLVGKGLDGVEALAGMSTLNGVPVSLAKAAAATANAGPRRQYEPEHDERTPSRR